MNVFVKNLFHSDKGIRNHALKSLLKSEKTKDEKALVLDALARVGSVTESLAKGHYLSAELAIQRFYKIVSILSRKQISGESHV